MILSYCLIILLIICYFALYPDCQHHKSDSIKQPISLVLLHPGAFTIILTRSRCLRHWTDTASRLHHKSGTVQLSPSSGWHRPTVSITTLAPSSFFNHQAETGQLFSSSGLHRPTVSIIRLTPVRCIHDLGTPSTV